MTHNVHIYFLNQQHYEGKCLFHVLWLVIILFVYNHFLFSLWIMFTCLINNDTNPTDDWRLYLIKLTKTFFFYRIKRLKLVRNVTRVIGRAARSQWTVNKDYCFTFKGEKYNNRKMWSIDTFLNLPLPKTCYENVNVLHIALAVHLFSMLLLSVNYLWLFLSF